MYGKHTVSALQSPLNLTAAAVSPGDCGVGIPDCTAIQWHCDDMIVPVGVTAKDW